MSSAPPLAPRRRTGDRPWSMRAVGRATGLGLGSVRNLMRAELGLFDEGDLGPVDALCVRVLAEIGANRSTNRRADIDARTEGLLRRDRAVVALLRQATAHGSPTPGTRLLVRGDACRLVTKDLEVLTELDAHPGESLQVLPIAAWVSELFDGLAES